MLIAIPWHALLAPDISAAEKILRTLAVYLFLLAGLRLAGKRELGQLNNFDLVVLLLLSNTLQNAIIGNDSSLAGGLLGAATLLVANYLAVRFLSRHPMVERVVAGEPEVLVRDGRVIESTLQRNLITRGDLEAAARRQGFERLDRIAVCRLEVGGALTFIPAQPTEEERRHRELMARLEALERRIASLGTGRGGAV